MDGDKTAVSEGMGRVEGQGGLVLHRCPVRSFENPPGGARPPPPAQAAGDDKTSPTSTGPREADPGEDSILMTI